MRKILTGIIFLALAGAAVPVGALLKGEPPRNVILIGWDGAGRGHFKECLNRGELPSVKALAAEGAMVEIDILRETCTKPGWTQILSGYLPEVTGVFSNTDFQPIPQGYTVYERLEKHFGPDNIVTAAIIAKKEHVDADAPRRVVYDEEEAMLRRRYGRLVKEKIVSENGKKYRLIPGRPWYHAQNALDLFLNGLMRDEAVGTNALLLLEKYKNRPFFFFVHFAEIDHSGHQHGENSKEYNDAYISADKWTGRIMQKLKELGIYDKTLIYLTSDHGFDEGARQHYDAPYVFLVTNDPEVKRRGERADIAPTIYDRFGLDLATIDPPLDGHSLIRPYEPPVWDNSEEAFLRKAESFTASMRPFGVRLDRGVSKVPERFDIVINNIFDRKLEGTLTWEVPEGSPWKMTETEVKISVLPGAQQKITVPVPSGADPNDSLTYEPRPVAIWDLYAGGRILPLWKNRMTPVLIDRWPYEEVTAQMKSAVSLKGVDGIVADRQVSSALPIQFENPTEWKMKVSTSWRIPQDSTWKISPAERIVALGPGEKGDAGFDVSFSGSPENLYPLPVLESVVQIDGEDVLSGSANLPLEASVYFLKEGRTASCARVKTAPKIDGKLDDAVWQECLLISRFLRPDARGTAAYPVEARLAYDPDNLYLSFRCFEPKIKEIKTTERKRDGAVWRDDSIEIFLDTDLDRETCYHFIINADGVVYDDFLFDRSWESSCAVKAGREDGAWTIEAALPWKSMGINSPGKGVKMGLELVRNRMPKPRELSQWSPTLCNDNYQLPRFGTLVLK